MKGTSCKSSEMSSSATLQARYGDVDERVLLNRGGLVAGVQLDLLRI